MTAPLTLGEILLMKGRLTQRALDEALAEQKRSGEFLGSILLRRRSIQEADLAEAFSEQFGMPCLRLKNHYIDWSLVDRFPPSLVLDCQCFPLRSDGYKIIFAVSNPLNAEGMAKALEGVGALKVEFVLTLPTDMGELLDRYRREVRARIRRSLNENKET